MKKYLHRLFADPLGEASIKRWLGTICAISLLVALFTSANPKVHYDPILIEVVAAIAGACIIGTVGEKFSPQLKNLLALKTEEVEP